MISLPARDGDETIAEAREIARLLRELEERLDLADEAGSALKAALRGVRRRRGLSRVVGQQAEAAIGRALTLTGQAMDESIAAHRLLDRLAPALGIDPAMFGDSSDDPSGSLSGADEKAVAA